MENRLRELRARYRLNQTYLGLFLGVSRQAVSQVESGRTRPTLDLAMRLACLFRVPVEEIFPNPYQTEPIPPGWQGPPPISVVMRRAR